MEEILILLSRYFYYKPVLLRKILEGFKNLKDVLAAPKDVFLNLGASGKALDDFMDNRSNSPSLWERGLQGDLKITTILDEKYPPALKNIYDPPPILFYRGNLSILENENNIAVIGSRKISDYGRRACEALVGELCKKFIIVSGLAYGVDGLSHEITVKNEQKTIAVLGSGLDDASIYPKSNISLAKKILGCGGLLLSEIPPGSGPQKFHFPMRNRIIAGISRGILIIEGGKKSGTLITARLGLEYGTDIFCVPGNIFSENSGGVNYLIKCGAHPVSSARDILEFYGIAAGEKEEYAPKNQAEKNILENLADEGKPSDELSRLTGMAIVDLMGTLTDLEMEGAIKNIGGKYVKT